MAYDSMYGYITTEKTAYLTNKVPVAGGYEWNMNDHITKSTLYKFSKFYKGANDGLRPFKNIIRPILNVSYRTEGFDVKDIEPFVNDSKNYYKSFLVRKFHPQWARMNNLDTFIDNVVGSYVDYGLTLVKNVNSERPEAVPLQMIAFCDQTDVLGGPLGLRHSYSIDQLKDMKGWDQAKIDEAITQAQAEKTTTNTPEIKAKTPGKYIEVYEVHGVFPKSWLNTSDAEDGSGEYDAEDEKPDYIRQAHYVTFYQTEDGKEQGICLWKGPEKEQIFKAIKRESYEGEMFGRACGYGGVEELFEDQTWTNYSELKIKKMLDNAALMILQTTDEAIATKNKIADLDQGQILSHKDGGALTQVNLQTLNIEQFTKKVAEWDAHARITGSASDPALGVNPSTGEPFKTTDLVTRNGEGLHEFRRGKISTFMSEIYRDWILKFLVKTMNEGQVFAETLSLDELQLIADQVVTNESNQVIINKIIAGEDVDMAAIDMMRQEMKLNFMKGGTKRFMEILKDELKDLPIDVEMNIAGKQKNLGKVADGLTNIFRQIIANPQILQAPGMGKLFNEIIEASGFSPVDFSSLTMITPQQSNPQPEKIPVREAVAA
jgi:hypothetical protein